MIEYFQMHHSIDEWEKNLNNIKSNNCKQKWLFILRKMIKITENINK